jgi:SAM-dependent methyltransferase
MGSRLQKPDRFNTWPILSSLADLSPRRLEIGPGLRPRLPIQGTWFIDLSQTAVEHLNHAGGIAKVGNLNSLPYPDGQFDLVCAFDVIEHVPDDQGAFRELSRVLQSNGLLCFSVPLHENNWSDFDDLVGHCHRYSPERISELLTSSGFTLEKSAPFGMMPRAKWLVDIGTWVHQRMKKKALALYHLFFPLAFLFQSDLKLVPDFINSANVNGVFVICRRVHPEFLPLS